MRKILLSVGILVLIALGIWIYIHLKNENKIGQANICQDDVLVIKLIDNNANPFSKFKYIKKRNDDCKLLLYENKENALKFQKQDYCPVLDSTTSSVTVLINTYVHEMYDRESASKALKTTVPLMTPYNYCPQYMNNMITLIQLKKRLGL